MPDLSLHVRSFALGALLCALLVGSVRFLAASGDTGRDAGAQNLDSNLVEFTTETRAVARLNPNGGVMSYYFVQGSVLHSCVWVESTRSFSCGRMSLQR